MRDVDDRVLTERMVRGNQKIASLCAKGFDDGLNLSQCPTRNRHQLRHARGAAAVAASFADLGQPLPDAACDVSLRVIERSQDVVEMVIERSGPTTCLCSSSSRIQ